MKQPFQIFSWHNPFLPALKAYLDKVTNAQPGRALVIVPNNRPLEYLVDLYRKDKAAGVLPSVLPFSKVVSIWRAQDSPRPASLASLLDSAALLHQCVAEIPNAELAEKLGKQDMQFFLPWGIRLAALLEELSTHGLDGHDILYAGNDVAAPAAQLLSSLGQISQLWRDKLRAMNWSTPGLENYAAIQNSGTIPPYLRPESDRPVIIAGFYALNGAEEALLRSLWEHGAHVCLHTDTTLADPACREHAKWLKRWRASSEVVDSGNGPRCSVKFFSGYDLHSQLKELSGQLATPSDASTAIVLSRPELLLPTLHHLPDKDINISMGYPLSRAPILRLIADLFELQLGRSADGRFYWRDVLKVLHQPHVRMLSSDPEDPGKSLRGALYAIERHIRHGEKFVSIDDLAVAGQECMARTGSENAPLLADALDVLLGSFSRVHTTAELAQAITGLIDMFINYGEGVIHSFPLDAEALSRIQEAIIPVLSDTLLAEHALPLETLYTIFRQLIEGVRVPFSAFPLEGTQILGLLETRLLHFDRVFILDATDDVLPGGIAQDPLLPDSLRPMLGLPDSRSRQNVIAHNLGRLCANAGEVNFFWQDDAAQSGLFDAKKIRSRYIEQLLWKEEEKLQRLLTKDDPLLQTAKAEIHIAQPIVPRILAGSPNIRGALQALLSSGLSATALDTWLACPFSFARTYLLKLSAPDEVSEGDNAGLVGSVIHDALAHTYAPFLNKEVRKGDITLETLLENLQKCAKRAGLEEILPLPAWLMFQMAAPVRLDRFLTSQPDLTYIEALEHEFRRSVHLGGTDLVMRGKVDRLDLRNSKRILLDYKTGKVEPPDEKIWRDDAFFQSLDSPEDRQLKLEMIRSKFKTLQLPFYISLLPEEEFGNAAWVCLGEHGLEVPLIPESLQGDQENVVRKCRQMIKFAIEALVSADSYEPLAGSKCKFCPDQKICNANA